MQPRPHIFPSCFLRRGVVDGDNLQRRAQSGESECVQSRQDEKVPCGGRHAITECIV